ncbi:hypothetical protein [Sphingopyxis sp. KK2]|uniref:hypothetical protein n=1 Tax=Sphingopyxis sp. KK2 TaxID=1855727 RepID=UPI0015C32CA1|nr:hypothetical protein [Sphingopyxis sp. KK2]
MTRGIRILGVSALVLAGALVGWLLQEQNLIDACLDAGGRWQSSGAYCEGITARHPQG